MSQDESFRRIKTLFGEMDDLCQERRRIYTDWGTRKITPEEFASRMIENLGRTTETAAALARILSPQA